MLDINNRLQDEIKAIEATYFDVADVYRNEEIVEGNINKPKRVCKIEKMSCALSKKREISANVDVMNNLEGEYVLFCSKELLKGDEIHLTTMNGRKYILLAGLPHDLISHFEIPVTVKERA